MRSGSFTQKITVCLILLLLIKYTEPVKSHKNVLFRVKREIYFILKTDIIKISLFVRDEKLSFPRKLEPRGTVQIRVLKLH